MNLREPSVLSFVVRAILRGVLNKVKCVSILRRVSKLPDESGRHALTLTLTLTLTLPLTLSLTLTLTLSLCRPFTDTVCHFSPKQQVVTLPSLSHLSQPTKQTRHVDHTSFIPISARTDVYKYSFFPRTLLDWNTLPADIRLKYSLSVSESADLVD